MKKIKIRFVCKDLTENIFYIYHHLNDFLNGLNLALNGRINKIISEDLFTGYKDKNGKEIYDGDICQRRWHSLPGFPVPEKENKIIETLSVKWNEDELAFMFGDNTRLGSYPSHHLEVVGNIYENSELLKEKGDKMNKLSKKELLQEMDTCLGRNDVSQKDFVIFHSLRYLLGEPDAHISMLVSCAYMRNVASLQHRTIYEFSQFIENVMSDKEEYKKYQFDWNNHNAIETWIEKFYEYCKEEYKEDACDSVLSEILNY